MPLAMNEYVTEWTPADLQRFKVVLNWCSRDTFFGVDNNPKSAFDKSILDSYPPDNPKCSVETIHFFMHSESYREDEDSLGDYAFALLWLCRYIIRPRYTCRNTLGTYSSNHGAKDCKYTLALQGKHETILFVMVADSVDEGMPRILAGLLAMHSQYAISPGKCTVRPIRPRYSVTLTGYNRSFRASFL